MSVQDFSPGCELRDTKDLGPSLLGQQIPALTRWLKNPFHELNPDPRVCMLQLHCRAVESHRS